MTAKTLQREELLARLELGEEAEFEAKEASGGFPRSFWESFSAMANSQGGVIVLGLKEEAGHFHVQGLRDPGKLLKEFWDQHNNPQKVSCRLLKEEDVEREELGEGGTVLVFHVPEALRRQRPVYLHGNPMTGTYKRNFQGDYRCTDDEVRRMLAEASDVPLDAEVLDRFVVDDLDPEAMRAYRARMRSAYPDHPFLAQEYQEFAQSIGAWRQDRATGAKGLTKAGLLSLGKEAAIREAFPSFHLDYQERLSADPEIRWTHRITLDGTWEGNLFNFYHRVIARLGRDLDVPFKLGEEGVRQEDTHVHQALREALVNALIHADYSATKAVVVVKSHNSFWFSNPGRLRIPLDQLYKGGASDCRNPGIQKLFQLTGLGEKAGSGFQKILRAWKEQDWMLPMVHERADLELTQVLLRAVSLVPASVRKDLESRFGERYSRASHDEQTALVLAQQFGHVTNAELQRYVDLHPADISRLLSGLSDDQLLVKSSRGRGTSYRLFGQQTESQSDLFGLDHEAVPEKPSTTMGSGNAEQMPPSSVHSDPSSVHLDPSSVHLAATDYLRRLAEPVALKKKTEKKVVEDTIRKVCSTGYVSLETLGDLLQRSPQTLRIHYLNRMLKKKKLELKYPDKPSHPEQAYRNVSSSKKGG